MLALAALLCAFQVFFLAVEAFAAAGDQGAGLLDSRPGALLQVLDGHAQTLAMLVEIPLAFVGLAFACVGQVLTLISPALACVGLAFTLISLVLTLIGQALTLIGLALTLIGPVLPLVGRLLLGSLGFPPGCLPVRPSRGWVSSAHGSTMHRCHRGC